MAVVAVNISALNNFINRTVQPYLVGKAEEIANEARTLAPTGATGELRNSINVERIANGGVSVRVDAPYAEAVHQGTGAGHIPDARPNYFPRVRKRGLILWADSRNLNPYAVAAGISKHGTKANPFLENAVQKVLGRFQFRWIKKDFG
jgi:hypothetical protein